jgi:uncharacterized membrane protein
MDRPVFARISRWAPSGLAALFIASGTLHVIRPSLFLPLVPNAMPARDLVVLVSGFAELACAAGLLSRAAWARPASALLLCAVFPGNVAFAVDASRDPDASTALTAAAWARLPMQLPLIWAALQARRV